MNKNLANEVLELAYQFDHSQFPVDAIFLESLQVPEEALSAYESGRGGESSGRTVQDA